jgi:hypothetical protein
MQNKQREKIPTLNVNHSTCVAKKSKMILPFFAYLFFSTYSLFHVDPISKIGPAAGKMTMFGFFGGLINS